jgi:hypothetical protein
MTNLRLARPVSIVAQVEGSGTPEFRDVPFALIVLISPGFIAKALEIACEGEW